MGRAEQIALAQAMVEDETIHLFLTNPHAQYQDYIDQLSWYWALPADFKRPWVTSWIRCLTTGLDFQEI